VVSLALFVVGSSALFCSLSALYEIIPAILELNSKFAGIIL
jgi:ABC-type polysaccharide/polyol phosphate export permease